MGILSFISSIFKPAVELVDNVSTTDEERLQLRNELASIQKEVSIKSMALEGKVIELQAKLSESAAKVAVAETQSESWFTRTYRPAIVVGMFLLISANAFGWLPNQLPDIFVTIFGSVFGVVGIGRSVEKIRRVSRG